MIHPTLKHSLHTEMQCRLHRLVLWAMRLAGFDSAASSLSAGVDIPEGVPGVCSCGKDASSLEGISFSRDATLALACGFFDLDFFVVTKRMTVYN
ncbi:uncharacterized protein PHACADRAFT_266308 [Phanerochaete carnosa HHB-10118-sp]|uniref:Uncharacterized protein n=1 Tax=Phanerochaete carnosa (strain HHB-10118-sp) TaxID=650164 RepID=K5VBQ2_PHACS|nr:uncharacterized protein PHACADRAFT_266308 [Phanerochaete carnosa HHB-10118-sp]EKM48538.1 hypothetical protein PHACADRAFT_266308 [Phanerochaete carnosa HHB-10118-sp]